MVSKLKTSLQMKDFTITIYCFLDDFILKLDRTVLNKRRKLTNPQAITLFQFLSDYF